MKKNLPGNFLFHAALNRQSEEESKIAVSEIVREFDVLEENNLINDPEILSHINDLINSLQIIGELDGKIKEKKPLMELFKKRNVEELSEITDALYDIYIPEEEWSYYIYQSSWRIITLSAFPSSVIYRMFIDESHRQIGWVLLIKYSAEYILPFFITGLTSPSLTPIQGLIDPNCTKD